MTLDDAYRRAIYRICTQPALVLKIGAVNPMLKELTGSTEGVLITACNPRSRRLRPASNARRTHALQRAIERLGQQPIAATSEDPQAVWPQEAGYWIPDALLAAGLQLARQFQQNAIIWCDRTSTAHLIWVTDAVHTQGVNSPLHGAEDV